MNKSTVELNLEDYIKRSEVKEKLNVSISTLTRMENRGELIKYMFGGRAYYLKSDVLAQIQPAPVPDVPQE